MAGKIVFDVRYQMIEYIFGLLVKMALTIKEMVMTSIFPWIDQRSESCSVPLVGQPFVLFRLLGCIVGGGIGMALERKAGKAVVKGNVAAVEKILRLKAAATGRSGDQ
ncbi:MAG: hypothetical protein V4733_01535 [Verrucomicrobiota bacterium]